MSTISLSSKVDPGITETLSEYLMSLNFEKIPETSKTVAKHCLLDWMGVSVAGLEESVTKLIIDQVSFEGGNQQATIIGDGRKVSLSQAALVNGTSSHALDFDDVQTRLQGHPTVTVAPTVLALGEFHRASGTEVLTAFIAGVEAECRIGAYIGMSHYF